MECKGHRDLTQIECEDFADDAFYAEIRRQILLLTADDEEEPVMHGKLKKRSSGSKGSFMKLKGANHQLGFWENNDHGTNCSAPAWLSNLWRNHGNGSGGTGVFIPHIVKSRRKYKSGRRGTLVM